MSSIRLMSLAALALVALTSVACAPAAVEEAEGENAGSSGLAQPANAGDDERASTGTCEATCTHFLTCKGASTPANQTQCVAECKSAGLTSADMATFEKADCATINAPSPTNSSSSGSSPAPSNECDGCVADGSYCIWTSKSNWGKGPASGAVIECASHCCE